MSNEESALLYSKNQDYKAYVNKYCATTGCTLPEALKKMIVKEVGIEYRKGEINYKERSNE